MTKLTANFSLEEFTDSQTAARQGIKNEPTERQLKNLQRIAETLEKVRTVLDDKPVLISSGFRSPKVNAAVGGSLNSAHTHGLAADFICPEFGTPLEICRALESYMETLDVDQLINEFPPSGWVHFGLRDGKPRHQCLTIDKYGAHNGFG
jgi:zinc D-Ala-D-Ala carboxypeptidase